MKQFIAKVLENEKIADRQYKMLLSADFQEEVLPGQFVHIRCSGDLDPLLRRPMSIYRMNQDKGAMEVLYKVVGRGTALLSAKKEGNEVDVIAPLGNGFTLQKDGVAIIAAGGIGAAAVYILAEKLIEKGIKKVYYLFGAKTGGEVVCEDDFKELGCEVEVCTEDGERGKKGLVTHLLEDLLQATISGQKATIYSCGPMPMLKAIVGVAGKFNVPCQVSLEERMGCGVGVCMSCVVKCKSGDSFEYKRVCKYGPVFDAGEIMWE